VASTLSVEQTTSEGAGEIRIVPDGPAETSRFANHEVAVSQSIAVINAGSSSIKFALYDAMREKNCLFRGQISGISVAPRLKVADDKGETVEERAFPPESLDHDAAMREILAVGAKLLRGEPVAAFGHRVVHGGLRYDSPVRVTSDVLDDLRTLAPLAPLHQPHNLAAISTIMNVAPQIPQVACFDTAFHRKQSSLAQAFALPRRYLEAGIRRYGFHGLSYEFLAARFGELAPSLANARIVIAHLGNGASMCAVKDGRSVATTMGFTAVDGLMMGTRCGAIDPGVILYMMQEQGMDAVAIEDLIYRQSGLLGVSGCRFPPRFDPGFPLRTDPA
jgi:acetate kinase